MGKFFAGVVLLIATGLVVEVVELHDPMVGITPKNVVQEISKDVPNLPDTADRDADIGAKWKGREFEIVGDVDRVFDTVGPTITFFHTSWPTFNTTIDVESSDDRISKDRMHKYEVGEPIPLRCTVDKVTKGSLGGFVFPYIYATCKETH